MTCAQHQRGEGRVTHSGEGQVESPLRGMAGEGCGLRGVLWVKERGWLGEGDLGVSFGLLETAGL